MGKINFQENMMTEFTIHDLETAPDDSKPLLEAARSRLGFIPNLFFVMAEAPTMLEGYLKMHELALSNSFDADETTVIWQSINVEYQCHYCVPQHTAIAKMSGVSDEISAALRSETPLADAKLEALRTFTLELVRERGRPGEAVLQAFRAAGYSNQHILEVIQMIAHKVMSNYTNSVAQTPLDPMLEPLTWSSKVREQV